MLDRIKFTLILTALTLTPLQAQAQGYAGGPGYWYDNWGWGHMLFGSLMMLLFWGGIILLVVLVVRSIGSGSAGRTGAPSVGKTPLDILNERFARGEIDNEEFEERTKRLSA